MAEGGDLTSINHGSDADFEYTCTPCGDDDIREEAVKYCPVCQEYLCATCTRHHGKLKAARSHTLLDCDASMKAITVMVTKCRYHPDRDIEMFCEEHDMVYCTKCIATEHRSCTGISSLEQVNVSSDQQNEIEQLKTNMSKIQTLLEDIERNTQTNIDSVDNQRSDVISQIEEIEQNLIEQIRKLKQEALETLETECTVVKENLDTHIPKVRKVKEVIKREGQQLQAVDNFDKRQRFVTTKLIQQTVNDAMKVIEEIGAEVCQKLCFTENPELKSSVITSTCLGRVQYESNYPLSSKVYKVHSKKSINVKTTNENKVCYIGDICQLPDGTILLADYDNKRIKKLDEKYNIKDCLDVGDSPTGICSTGNTEVAVKLYNKVQFISVRNSLSKLRDISVSSGRCWGIAYCAGMLWISTGSGVNMYSMTGALLKTISKDVNGKDIIKSTTKRMSVSGDTVIVADDSDGAVCLRRDGEVMRQFRDERLGKSSSICFSNDGTVLIAGYASHNIVMFDKDGNCLGKLLDKDHDFKNPISMCYDKHKNCVLVGLLNSNSLVVLILSN